MISWKMVFGLETKKFEMRHVDDTKIDMRVSGRKKISKLSDFKTMTASAW